MFKEIIAPVVLWVLAILVLASVLTAVAVQDYASDCAAKGGKHTVEGMTSWCRY